MCFFAAPAAAGASTATATYTAGGTAYAASATATYSTVSQAAIYTTMMANAANALSLLGTGMTAYGQHQSGKAMEKVAKNNEQIQNEQAADALRRGTQAEADHRRRVALIKGEQRAAMGANGIDLESGSALGVIEDTAQAGEYDAQRIRSNAEREAYGYRVGASNYGAQAEQDKYAGRYGASGTLLAGTGSVARDWYMYKGGFTNTYGSPGRIA